jgi:hypothetical protein
MLYIISSIRNRLKTDVLNLVYLILIHQGTSRKPIRSGDIAFSIRSTLRSGYLIEYDSHWLRSSITSPPLNG